MIQLNEPCSDKKIFDNIFLNSSDLSFISKNLFFAVD